MEQIFLIVHLVVALAIIGLIMLQQGKGADAGASFGAGASQTVFGSDGSGNVLTRSTSWLVVAFFATSFGLAVLASQKSKTVNELGLDIPTPAAIVQPAEDSDLPQVEDEFPAAAAMGSDVPELDSELPETAVPEEDVPQL